MRLTEKDWKDKRAGYPWTVHPVESYNDLKYYLNWRSTKMLRKNKKTIKN